MKLDVRNIEKRIGKKLILSDITMQLEEGKVYGLKGENGSGKTMLLKVVSGLIKNDSGSIYWQEKELHKDFDVLPNLGITIEHAGLFPWLTGYDNLKYLSEIKKEIGHPEIVNAIERVGLDPKDKRSYRKYSVGMKQRLSIAQAIMEKPDLLFLDEPTSGLDENGVARIRKILLEEKDRGCIVLVTSHIKEDFDGIADSVFEIKEGRLQGK